MRFAAIGLFLAVIGCTPLPTTGGAPAAGNAPTGATQAYFAGYPEALFFAAGAACDGPGQTVVRPNQNEVRCESLPDPESAAAIILQFDGSLEELPKFVIAFLGRDTADGYLVTADNYIRVPLRAGGVTQLRFPDPQITNEMEELLTAAGGRPL